MPQWRRQDLGHGRAQNLNIRVKHKKYYEIHAINSDKDIGLYIFSAQATI